MGGRDPQKHKAEVEKEEETICLCCGSSHTEPETLLRDNDVTQRDAVWELA